MSVDFAPLHAWVDESVHVDLGCYIMAAAVTEASSENLEHSRSALSTLLVGRQKRLHWRDETKSQRREALARKVAGLEVAGIALVATGVDLRKQDERARRKCLETLLDYVTLGGVEHVWMESRGEKDSRDRNLVAALRSRGALDRSVRVDFARPGDEPMLWAPDIIAGAVRVALAGDERYRADLAPVLVQREFELD